MLLGAAAQLVPDLDVVSYLWQDELDGIISHRGFSHSFFFIVFAGIAIAFAVSKIFPRLSFRVCLLVCVINLFTHVLLDSCNAYGTGWFEPFSHRRISLHLLFVIDPFFSVWPFLACLFLLFKKMPKHTRHWYSLGGISLCVLYLAYASFNKLLVTNSIQGGLKVHSIAAQESIITPSPFNSWLWYVIVKEKNGYYTTYRSSFDSRVANFHYTAQNDSLQIAAKDPEELQKLLRFAQRYYTIEEHNDTLTFNVLRFGQVVGWDNPTERFVFYYYLNKSGSNKLVVQRSRFERWDRKTIASFIRRIRGV
jgi:inner membrane protein